MGSSGRPWLDLNIPAPEDDETATCSDFTPQAQAPTHSNLSDRLLRIPNEHSFSHAPSLSGFQPFVRGREMKKLEESIAQNSNAYIGSGSKLDSTQDSVALNDSESSVLPGFEAQDKKQVKSKLTKHSRLSPVTISPVHVEGTVLDQSELRKSNDNDREEGEWSDKEDTTQPCGEVKADSGEGCSKGEITFSAPHAEHSVERIKASPRFIEKGFEEDNVDMDVDKKSVSDLNSNKGVNDKNYHEELHIIGSTSCLDINSKPVTSDKTCNSDKKQTAPSDTLDDMKVDVPRVGLPSNNPVKPVVLGIPNKAKGVDGQNEGKYSDFLSKKRKFDQLKEAKLGKKRDRQIKLVEWEDVRKPAPIKTPSSKRQSSIPSPSSHLGKDGVRSPHISIDNVGDKQSLHPTKDQRQGDSSSSEGGGVSEIYDHKRSDHNSEESSGTQIATSEKLSRSNSVAFSKRTNCNLDSSFEGLPPPVPRQSSWKQGTEQKHGKGHVSNWKSASAAGSLRESFDQRYAGRKHLLPSKKQGTNNASYQDTSVERLHREVTSEKFWHRSDETELQCVPGSFESVDEYVRVFEPLLFEECRAQLYSTWEEFCDTVSRDAYVVVRVKNIDKRERGWYDVTVLPMTDYKWTFKEGDVGVLSTPKPGAGMFKKSFSGLAGEIEPEVDVNGRVAGTVRRYVPIDTRDPMGAIVHFYVGDSHDDSSKASDDHILMKLQKKSTWYLAVLGSLATTQREYVALHSFRRLNVQMQKAILNPSPEHFPNYEQQPPAMPECFTANFIEHLRGNFNGPQLAAIQWAAMHTAAGTNGVGNARRQELWPFTLVQGPPGTGKTHTVWGMLNVIHLVQYQHYYGALLKKLAPESYRQINNNTSSNDVTGTGSIDDVLQSMDRNLFRLLPKLCPKPRMLVCAPSNAATDELLQRVLERGFIDGEMITYRPDVARVGVDSQNRAAQAVSVERRTENLLSKGREEVLSLINHLQCREKAISHKIGALQRDLSATAAAGRSQGTVGVDPDILVARDQSRDAMLQQLAAAVEERDKILVELSRLVILENRFCSGGENTEEARANLEASFANEAEIVFTTVSSSGRKLFQRLTHGFDMVVIDEAAQASEVAVLPPLSLGAARCVLVGDPQQLPATVISQAAGTLQYSRSLFERFQQAGCPTMLLSVQYRMHPQIRDFPSRYFYQNRLSDSESVVKRPDEVYYKDALLRPYLFYDLTHGRESHRGGSVSYQNVHEAQFALLLYEHLQKAAKSVGLKVSVGIITPYKLQLKCLQREFECVLKSEEGKGLYINTVDAFQGQERDVIIMSCVRASNHGVGFVADIRRMNVALTRARSALWVMGNAAALKQSSDWSALIEDAKARGCFMDMESVPKDFFVTKAPSFVSSQARGGPNTRVPRIGGPNQRPPDAFVDAAVPWSNDEKSVIAKTAAHSASVTVSEKTRDAWQQGVTRGDRALLEEQKGSDTRAAMRSERTLSKYV